jgi:hypothetical protein
MIISHKDIRLLIKESIIEWTGKYISLSEVDILYDKIILKCRVKKETCDSDSDSD